MKNVVELLRIVVAWVSLEKKTTVRWTCFGKITRLILLGAAFAVGACDKMTEAQDFTRTSGNITVNFSNGGGQTFTPDEINALMRGFDYWNEHIPGLGAMTYTVSLAELDVETLASTDAIARTITFNTLFFKTSYSTAENTQLRGGTSEFNLTSTMIHEFAHAIGMTVTRSQSGDVDDGFANPQVFNLWIDNLFDSNGTQARPGMRFGDGTGGTFIVTDNEVTFRGTNAVRVFGTNVPVYSVPVYRSGSTVVHTETSLGNMNAIDDRNARPYFSEVELAAMIDLGHNSIVLSNFFGRSYYQPNTIDTNINGFNSTASYGVGLHIVSGRNQIIQDNDLIANGRAGAAIRVEGDGNKVTIVNTATPNDPTTRIIRANGEDGVGVLVTHGSATTLINRGTIEATGTNGRAIWFNASATGFDNTGTINAGTNGTAIHLDRSVGSINFMKGTEINGNIVVDGGWTTFTFGKQNFNGEFRDYGDSAFTMNYAGNFTGANIDICDIEAWGGETTLAAAALRFSTGTIGADTTGTKSALNLPGSAQFTSLTLGSTTNTTSLLDGQSSGAITVVNGITNRITVQNLASLEVPTIDNFNTIQGNVIVKTTDSFTDGDLLVGIKNERTGLFRDNTTIESNSAIRNLGYFVENGTILAKGIDNDGGIFQDNTTVQSLTSFTDPDDGLSVSIKNGEFGMFLDNINVFAGARLKNLNFFIGNGTVFAETSIDNEAGGVFFNTMTVLKSGTELTNAGNISQTAKMEVGDYLENSGRIDDTAKMSVATYLKNTGSIRETGAATIGEDVTNAENAEILDTGTLTIGGKLDNAGLIDTAMLIDVTDMIDNTGAIQNVANLKTKSNLNNAAGATLLDSGTVTVEGKLDNKGVIHTALAIDVTDGIDNADAIQNVALLKTPRNLNNKTGAKILASGTIEVGGVLDNLGMLDTATLIDVTGNIENGKTIQNILTLKSDADLNNTAGALLLNLGTVQIKGKFENWNLLDTAILVDITGRIDNRDTIQNILTLQTGADLNNLTGSQILSSGTVVVQGKLTNAGLIDTVASVDITGNIDNSKNIQNVQLLKTTSDLNNAAMGQVLDSGKIEITGKLNNLGLVDTATLVEVKGNIENGKTIQNVVTLKTSSDFNNAADGVAFDNKTVTVGGELNNLGLIDTATLADVTGNIENAKIIRNVLALKTAADLVNKTGAFIVDNQTVHAGRDMNNDGTVNGFTTLGIGRDANNTVNGFINVDKASTMNVANSGFNDGCITMNGVSTYGNQFTNNTTGFIDGNGKTTTLNGFFNNGTISVGDPNSAKVLNTDTLTIVGAFTNDTTGTFEVEIDPSHYPDKPIAGFHNDLVNIVDNPATTSKDGKATVNGGIVNVTAPSNEKKLNANPARYVGNTHYTFLDTENELTVTEEIVANDPPNLLLFDFLADHDNKSYWLDVQREYYYGPFGKTFNQIAFGNYIDDIGLDPDPNGDLFPILVTLDSFNAGIPHRTEISDTARYALDQMSGSIYGSVGTASIQNLTILNNTLTGMLRRNALGANTVMPCDPCAPRQPACDPCQPVCGTVACKSTMWGLGFGIGGSTKHDNNAYGYNQSVGGTLFGIDNAYRRNYRVGLFGSYAESHINMSGLSEKSKTKELLFGVYVRKEMLIGYILATGGLGYDKFDTERNITLFERQAKSDHDAFTAMAYIERGLEYRDAFGTWQPFFGLQYGAVQQDGFKETGAGVLNLQSDIINTSSFRSMLGCRLSTEMSRCSHKKTGFDFNAIWMHEFLDRAYSPVTAQLSNPNGTNFSATSKYTIRGNNPGRDWAILGISMHYDSHSLRFFGGYDAYINARQTLHTGNVGLAYGW